jgi:AraC-like DNA-binding protein
MTVLAPMTRIMRLDVPAACAGAKISRQAIGPLNLIEFGGLDYCQTATAKTVDGVPEGISLAVRPAGRWSLSQGGRTRGSATNDFLTLVDVTQAMRVEPDSGTRLFQMFFSAEQLGLTVDAIRVAAANIERSPLRGLVASHVLQLSAEGIDLLPRETQRSLAEATIELVRALLTSTGCPGEQTGGEIGREALRFAAKQHIRRHLRDPGLSPAVVARAHHVSVRHLYQVWDEPVSVARWIGQLRLEAARADLADPRLAYKSIAAVGREWGFPSPGHFARRFREVYAVSPRDWRGTSQTSRLGEAPGPDHSTRLGPAGLGRARTRRLGRPRRGDQDWMKASRSGLSTSACVVSIPCGKPGYVFSVPFCTSLTVRGPEVSWGTTWSASPFMARTGTLTFFRSSE